MQNAQELSQPIWIVIQAEWSTSRRAGNADGYSSCSSRISTTGPLRAGPREQLGRVSKVVGTEHDVDVRGALAHEIAILLREAPANRDLQLRSALLELLEPAEMAVELVVGVLPDAARVQHDNVGRFEIVGRFHAVGDQETGDPLGVVLVHLAAVRAHEEPTRHADSVRVAWPVPAVQLFGAN